MESTMKKSVVIMGAVASSMMAGAVPARSDIGRAPQLEAASAADLRPISPAARNHILDLPRIAGSQFIQGGFSETGPDPKHFSQGHFNQTPTLELKRKKPKDPKEHGLLLPTTDVAAAYLAFRKTDSA
jgi:hypothetical protein